MGTLAWLARLNSGELSEGIVCWLPGGVKNTQLPVLRPGRVGWRDWYRLPPFIARGARRNL